jgi:thymidylate synthase (FAD)
LRIVKAKAEILRPDLSPESINAIYRNIEIAGRTCYKSEDKITSDSSRKFVRALVKSGHEAMIEHATMTVRFTVDRGISHEIVRHRIASFAQSSTRYCNYSNAKFGHEITVIKPFFLKEDTVAYEAWKKAMINCETAYFEMLQEGCTAQEARSVLPNSLMTEIVVTANMREWRNIFKLRAAGTTGAPHPQMREVMIPLLKQCQELMPELFDDIIIKGE